MEHIRDRAPVRATQLHFLLVSQRPVGTATSTSRQKKPMQYSNGGISPPKGPWMVPD